MRVLHRDRLYRVHSKTNEPGLTVASGERFLVQTELNSGDWLSNMNDIWSREKGKGPNLTVCAGIQGAKPGDMLAVHIEAINVDSIGYTAFDEQFPLPYRIKRHAWGSKTV